MFGLNLLNQVIKLKVNLIKKEESKIRKYWWKQFDLLVQYI